MYDGLGKDQVKGVIYVIALATLLTFVVVASSSCTPCAYAQEPTIQEVAEAVTAPEPAAEHVHKFVDGACECGVLPTYQFMQNTVATLVINCERGLVTAVVIVKDQPPTRLTFLADGGKIRLMNTEAGQVSVTFPSDAEPAKGPTE